MTVRQSRHFVLVALATAWLLVVVPHARAEVQQVTVPVTEFSGETTDLWARLTRPDGDGPFPAVVLLHGCDGTNLGRPWGIEETLKGSGIASLRINSFGPRGYYNVCGEIVAEVGPRIRALDAHAGKDYLKSLPFIDGDKIGVVGWSHGGMTVLSAVSNDAIHEPVRPDPFKVAVAFYPLCSLKLHRLDAPLLVMIGDADDWTRSAYCESMTLEGETTHEYELVVYPSATHAFDWEGGPDEYFGYKIIYDPEATEDAYRRLETFLALHLQAP